MLRLITVDLLVPNRLAIYQDDIKKGDNINYYEGIIKREETQVHSHMNSNTLKYMHFYSCYVSFFILIYAYIHLYKSMIILS